MANNFGFSSDDELSDVDIVENPPKKLKYGKLVDSDNTTNNKSGLSVSTQNKAIQSVLKNLVSIYHSSFIDLTLFKCLLLICLFLYRNT